MGEVGTAVWATPVLDRSNGLLVRAALVHGHGGTASSTRSLRSMVWQQKTSAVRTEASACTVLGCQQPSHVGLCATVAATAVEMLTAVPYRSRHDQDAAAGVAVRLLLDGQCPYPVAVTAAKASYAGMDANAALASDVWSRRLSHCAVSRAHSIAGFDRRCTFKLAPCVAPCTHFAMVSCMHGKKAQSTRRLCQTCLCKTHWRLSSLRARTSFAGRKTAPRTVLVWRGYCSLSCCHVATAPA